ncbi:MAG: hypothetical protein EA409_12340, partial [Saprospirales bacterium]
MQLHSEILVGQSVCPKEEVPEILQSLDIADGEFPFFGIPDCENSSRKHNFELTTYNMPHVWRDGSFTHEQNLFMRDTLFFVISVESGYDIRNLTFINNEPEAEVYLENIEPIDEYRNLTTDYPHETEPMDVFVFRVELNGVVDDTCELYLGGAYEFDIVRISLAPRIYLTPIESVAPMFLHVGRLENAWDVNEYTLEKFVDLPLVGGDFISTGTGDYRPLFEQMHYVFADGRGSPVNLLSLTLPFIGDTETFYSIYLPHPDVACFRTPGSNFYSSLYLEGTLLIDWDYCFSSSFSDKYIWDDEVNVGLNPRVIYMGPDAKIVIESGREFTIERTIVLSCDTLWNSIVVEDGAILNINDSYIRDGINAIKVMPGGTLNITRSIFDANHVSIYSPPSGDGSRYNINQGPFFGNEFINANPLKIYPEGYNGIETEVPYAAILLNDLNLFMASGIGHSGYIEKNTIEDIPFGIWMRNSGLDIQNYQIVNANPINHYGGTAITLWNDDLVYSSIRGNSDGSSTPNIQNSSNGIVLINGNNHISGNVIEDVVFGIRVDQERIAFNFIKDNSINAAEIGIYNWIRRRGILNIEDNLVAMGKDGSPTNSSTGILIEGIGLSNLTPTRILNNEINLVKNILNGMNVNSVPNSRIRGNEVSIGQALSEYMGIALQNSRNSLMDYNSISGVSGDPFPSTAVFLGDNPWFRLNCNETSFTETGVNVILENLGSELKGNVFGQHFFYGLLFGYQGQPSSSQAVHQTGEQHHHGNIWDYGFGPDPVAIGGYHANVVGIAERSRFYVDDIANPNHTTSRSPEEWFEEESAPMGTWTCPGEMPENEWYDYVPRSEATDPDIRLVTVERPFEDHNFEASLTYIARRNLHQRMMDGYYAQNVLDAVIFSDFLQEIQDSSIGVFYQVRSTIESALGMDSVVIEAIGAQSALLQTTLLEVYQLDSIAWLDTANVDTAQWISDRRVLTDSILNLLGILNDLYLSDSLEIENPAQDLKTMLNGVSISTLPEYAEREILLILVNHLFDGSFEFNHAEILTIIEISEYCPAEAGTAVYWARNLRNT